MDPEAVIETAETVESNAPFIGSPVSEPKADEPEGSVTTQPPETEYPMKDEVIPESAPTPPAQGIMMNPENQFWTMMSGDGPLIHVIRNVGTLIASGNGVCYVPGVSLIGGELRSMK